MSTPHRILSPGLAVFVAMSGIFLGGVVTFLNMALEGGSIAVIGFTVLYLYFDRKHTPGLLIGPAFFLFCFHALGYAIGPLAQRYVLHQEVFIEKGMVLAQWGAVLGLTTFAFIYPKVFLAVSRRFHEDQSVGQRDDMGAYGWVGYTVLLLIVSVTLVLYGYFSGGLRRIGVTADVSLITFTIIASFSAVQYVVFFFLGVLAIKRRGWWLVLTFSLYLAYAGYQTLEGNRGPLLSSLLMLASGAVWAGFSIRKTFFALAMSALILVPLAGIVNLYRQATSLAQYEEGLLGRVAAFSQAASNLKASQLEGGEIANKALIYAVSAITVDRVMVMTPDIIPHAGFESLSALFFMYVPAFVAPNRPDIDDGVNIAAVYGIGTGKGGTSYYYIPAVGEGYRRFGWIGIPILYALSGMLFGAVVALCWEKKKRREWAAMLVFLVLQSPAVWSFTYNYIVYFALSYLPKYYIYFFVLSKLQDFCFSFHNTVLGRSPAPFAINH